MRSVNPVIHYPTIMRLPMLDQWLPQLSKIRTGSDAFLNAIRICDCPHATVT